MAILDPVHSQGTSTGKVTCRGCTTSGSSVAQDKAKRRQHELERGPHHPRHHWLWSTREGTYLVLSPLSKLTSTTICRAMQPMRSINPVSAKLSRSQNLATTLAPSLPRRTLSTIPSSSVLGKISSKRPQRYSRQLGNAWQMSLSSLYMTTCTRMSSWPLLNRDITSYARNQWQRTCAISLQWRRQSTRLGSYSGWGMVCTICHDGRPRTHDVGTVLRYSPYGKAVTEVVRSGQLGELVNAVHVEPVGYFHFAHSYVRGSWAKEAKSCFSLMTKSCQYVSVILRLDTPSNDSIK